MRVKVSHYKKALRAELRLLAPLPVGFADLAEWALLKRIKSLVPSYEFTQIQSRLEAAKQLDIDEDEDNE